MKDFEKGALVGMAMVALELGLMGILPSAAATVGALVLVLVVHTTLAHRDG